MQVLNVDGDCSRSFGLGGDPDRHGCYHATFRSGFGGGGGGGDADADADVRHASASCVDLCDSGSDGDVLQSWGPNYHRRTSESTRRRSNSYQETPCMERLNTISLFCKKKIYF